MKPSSCLHVALPVPLPQLFDYLPPLQGPRPGAGVRVRVPFGKRSLVGVVVATDCISDLPTDRLQRIEETLDDGQPVLDAALLGLLRWCWRYYKRAPGDVVAGEVDQVAGTEVRVGLGIVCAHELGAAPESGVAASGQAEARLDGVGVAAGADDVATRDEIPDLLQGPALEAGVLPGHQADHPLPQGELALPRGQRPGVALA